MRLNFLQFTANASVMMSSLFIPVLAVELGASHSQVGIIGAVYGASLFLSSYIFGRAADEYPPKILLSFGFAASAIAFFLQIFAFNPFSLALVRGLAGFSIGIFPAALLLYVYTLRRDLGKFISFISLGWAAGNFIAGIVAVYWGIFAISSLLFAFGFLVSLTLPEAESPGKRVDYFSFDIVRRNWWVYFSFALRHVGASGVWVVFPLYLASLGASPFWIGVIYTLNPFAQFFLMRRLEGFRDYRLVKMGSFLSIVAFASLIPLNIFYQSVPGMLLVAGSWSFLYVGSTLFLMSRNVEKATASGLLSSTISLSNVIGSFIGGFVSEYVSEAFGSEVFGFRAVLLMAVILSFGSHLAFRSIVSADLKKV